jgi:hypothetical protein
MLELILGADAHLWATVARWYGEFALTILIVVIAVQRPDQARRSNTRQRVRNDTHRRRVREYYWLQSGRTWRPSLASSM